jgi:outer membrane protein insertion porin family
MRYSLGLGVTWLSGFGPLSFGVAQVFNEDADDQTQFFQFELGRTF